MTDYRPIDCGQHSDYELAIIQQRRLRLSWHDPAGVSHTRTVTPVDVFTHRGEEFMRVREVDGLEHLIRLDRITACAFL
ncbi:MAG: transcriptional antiterminator, Rof [Gammaproteobacteria bacterium]